LLQRNIPVLEFGLGTNSFLHVDISADSCHDDPHAPTPHRLGWLQGFGELAGVLGVLEGGVAGGVGDVVRAASQFVSTLA
jgi:hypothetical protein